MVKECVAWLAPIRARMFQTFVDIPLMIKVGECEQLHAIRLVKECMEENFSFANEYLGPIHVDCEEDRDRDVPVGRPSGSNCFQEIPS